VNGFTEILRQVAARVPEARVLMIMGADGIPVDRLVVSPDANVEAVAAELTTVLRGSLAASSDTGLGALEELTVVSEGMTTVVRAITPEYFLFAAVAPGAILGRVRVALRVGCLRLEREFA
jgi:predicted regulator of Ras-like GTPase activity (Roadblock/LC7/MglB family)